MGIDIRRLGEVPLSDKPQVIRVGNSIEMGKYRLTLNNAGVKNFHLMIERENAKHPNWFPYNTTYMLDQLILFNGRVKSAGRRLDLEIQFGTESDLEKWKGH